MIFDSVVDTRKNSNETRSSYKTIEKCINEHAQIKTLKVMQDVFNRCLCLICTPTNTRFIDTNSSKYFKNVNYVLFKTTNGCKFKEVINDVLGKKLACIFTVINLYV